MINYVKLIIIQRNRYIVRTDRIDDLGLLFQNLANVNTTLVLVLSHGTDIHTIDLGALFIQHIDLLLSPNIEVLIDQLTPELIYSYRIDLFNQSRPIRSFMSHDLKERVTVSPCNLNTGEMTNTSYDPNYSDLLIKCDDFDLNQCVPVLNNKLRYCEWHDGIIYLDDRVDLARNLHEVTFVSFGAVEVKLKTMREMINNAWSIDTGYIPIVVLAGSFFYDDPFVYRIENQRNKLFINSEFVKKQFRDQGYLTEDQVMDDQDSFVILVKAEKLLVRDLYMIHDKNNKFMYYEESDQDAHLDYLCIDKEQYTIHGVTLANEMYRNDVTNKDPYMRHVYTNGGSDDMRLIQITAF